MTITILSRARPVIQEMKAYMSARSLMEGCHEELIFLDANECSYEPFEGAGNLNRYADQQPKPVRTALANLYGVQTKNILITRGADEAIDLIVRAFCDKGDLIITTSPCFPMYAHAAKLQEAGVKDVPLLLPDFSLDVAAVIDGIEARTKIIFLCTPNNPTGSLVTREQVIAICEAARDKSLVILEEIYIEFSDQKSCLDLIEKYPNLVITRSLSKAYAAAGIRCGVAAGHEELIAFLQKLLAVYPVPQPVAATALKILEPKNIQHLQDKAKETAFLRDQHQEKFKTLACVDHVFQTQSNFMLVRFKDAETVMAATREVGFILRDQSALTNMKNCIRFSVGTPEQMEALFNVLKSL